MRSKLFATAAILAAITISSPLTAEDFSERVDQIATAKTRQDRRKIVDELREEGDKAREAIVAGLANENADVRKACIGLLASMNNAADIAAIAKLMGAEEKNAIVRSAAIYALGRFTGLDAGNQATIRTHLVSRFGAEDVTDAELVAVLTAMLSFPDASLISTVNAKLKPGVSASVANAIISVMEACGDASASALVSFLDTEVEEKPEGDKPEGDKPEGDTSEGDKPEGDKPEEEKPAKMVWAFKPTAQNDVRIWNVVRARAIAALASFNHPKVSDYLIGTLSQGTLTGTLAKTTLDDISKQYAEALAPKLIEVLEDNKRSREHSSATSMLAHLGGDSLAPINAKLDEATAKRAEEIAKKKAEGETDPKVANSYEHTYSRIVGDFAKSKAGREQLLARMNAAGLPEGDPSHAKIIQQTFNVRDAAFKNDQLSQVCVLAALSQENAGTVRQGINKWGEVRGFHTFFELIDALMANPHEDILNDENIVRSGVSKLQEMINRRAGNRMGEESLAKIKALTKHENEIVRETTWAAVGQLDNPDFFELFAEGFKDESPRVAKACGVAFPAFCSNLALDSDKRSSLQDKAKSIALEGFKLKNAASAGLAASLNQVIARIFGSANQNGPMQDSYKALARELIDSEDAYLRVSASKLPAQYHNEDFKKKVFDAYQNEENPAVADAMGIALNSQIAQLSKADKEKVLERAIFWQRTGNDLKQGDYGISEQPETRIRVAQTSQTLISSIGDKTRGTLQELAERAVINELKTIAPALADADPEAAKPLLNSFANMMMLLTRLNIDSQKELVITTILAVDETKHNPDSTVKGAISQAAYNFLKDHAEQSDLKRIEKVPFMTARMTGLQNAVKQRVEADARAAEGTSGK